MSPEVDPRRAFWLLLIAHGLLALGYLLSTPPWEAPDEPAHYRRVDKLAHGPSIARAYNVKASVRPMMSDAGIIRVRARGSTEPHPPMRETWTRQYLLSNYERAQPAAGYLPFVPIAMLLGPWSPPVFVNPSFGEGSEVAVFLHDVDDDPGVGSWRLRILRLPSLLLGLLIVAATYRAGRRVAPEQPGVALGAAAVVAFLPQFTFTAGYLGNDMPAALFGTLCIGALARGLVDMERPTPRWVLTASVFAALGVACRLNAVGLAAFVILAWLTLAGRANGLLGAAKHGGIVATLLGTGLVGWRWLHPESWGPLSRQFEGRILGSGEAMDFAEVSRALGSSFVGDFGWLIVPMPNWAYLAFGGLGLSLAGLGLRVVLQAGVSRSTRWRALGAVLGAGFLIAVASIVRNALSSEQCQGRYLFPYLAAFALLCGLGIAGGVSARAGCRRALGLALLLASSNALVLFGVLRPALTPTAGRPGGASVTRLETPAGPLFVQHGGIDSDSGGDLLAPGSGGLLVLAASMESDLRLDLELHAEYRHSLGTPAPVIYETDSIAEKRAPGIRSLQPTGPGVARLQARLPAGSALTLHFEDQGALPADERLVLRLVHRAP